MKIHSNEEKGNNLQSFFVDKPQKVKVALSLEFNLICLRATASRQTKARNILYLYRYLTRRPTDSRFEITNLPSLSSHKVSALWLAHSISLPDIFFSHYDVAIFVVLHLLFTNNAASGFSFNNNGQTVRFVLLLIPRGCSFTSSPPRRRRRRPLLLVGAIAAVCTAISFSFCLLLLRFICADHSLT